MSCRYEKRKQRFYFRSVECVRRGIVPTDKVETFLPCSARIDENCVADLYTRKWISAKMKQN